MSPMTVPRDSRSLWKDLADGSAGKGVRAVVTLALAVLITGFCLIGTYALAAVVPGWDESYGWGVHPRDELLVAVLTFGAILFLASAAWVWWREARFRVLCVPTLVTAGIVVVTVPLCVVIDRALSGDDELVVGGLVLLGIAAVLVVWLRVWNMHFRPRDVRSAEDGLVDVRCPACGYRMVGLRESRCPECGAEYTLDQLLAARGFAQPVGGGDVAVAAADASAGQAQNRDGAAIDR